MQGHDDLSAALDLIREKAQEMTARTENLITAFFWLRDGVMNAVPSHSILSVRAVASSENAKGREDKVFLLRVNAS